MSVIGPRIHGILDYATVVFFLLSPTALFPNLLVGGVGTLCYVLAVVYLTMTLLTDFPLGMVEVISLSVHGVVELIVSLTLVVLPWILAPAFQTGMAGRGAQWFYTAVGVAIFLVWVLSDYTATPSSSKTSPKPPPKRDPEASSPSAEARSSDT
ncbi:MAG: hypothetical protein BRD46_03285 [Bacteroidetes bacterium QS_8_68_15]|nr:MAG: hypothetical protein BRD46_03285 [Bacteroidetes bacterium QS_8_68_15]